MKEEEFAKKLQEMTLEEEKMRIPIAQGLPWTTDEPEVSSSTIRSSWTFYKYLVIYRIYLILMCSWGKFTSRI